MDVLFDDYIQSMLRLRKLPVNVVHGGHERSFGRERLAQIIDHYLGLWNSREAILTGIELQTLSNDP